MGPRPTHLNLGDDRSDAFRAPKMPFVQRDMPSPRTGEIPPALSPLDAFAMQSRLLARKFEEENENGRRMSRLPPTMVAKEMSSRPGYFRDASNESKMSDLPETNEETSPISMRAQVQDENPSKERPISHYPSLEMVPKSEEDVPPLPTPFFDAVEQRPKSSTKGVPDYFALGAPRATSPEPVDTGLVNVQAPSPNAYPSLTSSIDTVSSHPRTMTNDSQRSQRSSTMEKGLAPPQSPRFPRSPRSFQSIRSVPPESCDEDVVSMTGSQTVSTSRKFSGSSGMSRPQSPFSPWMNPIHRSPSMTSEYSINGSQQLQRPAANFSRPMSSAGSRPSVDTRPSFDSRPSSERRRPDFPHRQRSGASTSTDQSFRPAISRQSSGDDAETSSVLSQPGEEPQSDHTITPGAQPSSYIYAKYALPRNKILDRHSQAFRDSWIQKQFEWDKSHVQQHDRSEANSSSFDNRAVPSPSLSDFGRTGRSLTPNPSEIRSHSADPRSSGKVAAMHRSLPSVKTDSTDRTVKATPLHQKSASTDLSADEHLDIGIACHQAGETNKSTYHLRLAAISGLPTAMLMYGLACRHGWGMRASPEEGVKWLRKAIDISGLDVTSAEEKLNNAAGMPVDPVARKARKAQYALAIYELGQSSMHGWGCPKDKVMAVRCYEIAGDLGDGDALNSAAECYTNGLGCKKDLRKAAWLYRQAADKGVSMAGNNWIYKEKYMDENFDTAEKEKKRPDNAVSKEAKKDDKTVGRTRSRSIWGRPKKDREPQPTMPATGRLELD